MVIKSWVIVDGDRALFETWNGETARKVNDGTRYKAIPIVEWLHSINMDLKNV